MTELSSLLFKQQGAIPCVMCCIRRSVCVRSMPQDCTGLSIVPSASTSTMASAIHFRLSNCSPGWRNLTGCTKHRSGFCDRHTYVRSGLSSDYFAASGISTPASECIFKLTHCMYSISNDASKPACVFAPDSSLSSIRKH